MLSCCPETDVPPIRAFDATCGAEEVWQSSTPSFLTPKLQAEAAPMASRLYFPLLYVFYVARTLSEIHCSESVGCEEEIVSKEGLAHEAVTTITRFYGPNPLFPSTPDGQFMSHRQKVFPLPAGRRRTKA